MMIQRITQVQPVAGVQAPTLGDNRSLSSLPLHSESDYERYILNSPACARADKTA